MSISLSGSARLSGAAQAVRASRDSVYRAVWRWHFYAGLLCLPFLVTLSATGALYLFKDEINATAFAGRNVVTPTDKPLGPDRLIFEAMQAVPGGTPISYTDPARPDASALVTLAEGARKILVYLDPADGTVLDTVDRDDEFFMVVRRLHSLAYFGPLANGLIEVVAGFAIILVVTGVYLWWPRGQDGGVVSVRGTPRRRVWWRDLHAVTGFVAGGGLLFLALTGLPWSIWWGDQLRSWSNTAGLGQPAALYANKPVSALPLNAVLDSAGWTMQDAPVPSSTASGKPIGIDDAAAILTRLGMPRGYELSLPVGPQGVYAAAVYPKDVARQRVVSLDQYSGKPLLDVPFQDLGPVGRLIQYGIGIHLGQYWGRANQLAMLAFCLATILLSVTAGTMWWKRRPQGSLGTPPWPRDRRVVATVTGLVLVLGALFPLTGFAILAMLGLDLVLGGARRRASLALFGLALVGASSGGARAQEAVTLEELSVTGEGGAPAPVPGFGVSGPPNGASLVIDRPVGQVVSQIDRTNVIANRPATSIGSVLVNSPGVTVRQGNGARDVIVSIRGNNARSTGVIKNMVVLEDGFSLTQPDGASRFDLTDPRAYSRIDVFRGPQSALFGNYATGGAIAFRTRTGREIDGYEVGVDAGSFGYLSNYFTVGGVSGPFEISLFASDVRGNGYQDHSSYDTQTINLLASYTPTPDNRFTLKVINNDLHANLAARSSLAQYRINPYQLGCAAAATAAPGCTTYNYFVNGAFGRTVPVTATEASLQRNDRRTVVALRYEHDIDADTTWRTQLVFDERNFNQPFYTTASTGSYPSWNLLTDLTKRGDLFGLPAVGYVALAYNRLDLGIATYNRAPYNGPSLGGADRRSECRSGQSRRARPRRGGAHRPRDGGRWDQRGIDPHHRPQPCLQLCGERHHPERRRYRPPLSQHGPRTRPCLSPERRVAVPQPGRDRLHDARRLEFVHHPGGLARQQHAAEDAGESRFRPRGRLDSGAGRDLQHHRLLRVLPQRTRLAIAGRGASGLHVQRTGLGASRHRGGGRLGIRPRLAGDRGLRLQRPILYEVRGADQRGHSHAELRPGGQPHPRRSCEPAPRPGRLRRPDGPAGGSRRLRRDRLPGRFCHRQRKLAEGAGLHDRQRQHPLRDGAEWRLCEAAERVF